MGYGALTAFLSEPIAKRDETIPDAEKTPAYWAERLGEEWFWLNHADLKAKLLPFFEEMQRLYEVEKAWLNR